MVSFQCDACSDVVKKPKLDKHYSSCYATFTCIDCSTTFPGPAQYKAHTSCISEAEKYQKSVYKGPRSNNNNGRFGGAQPAFQGGAYFRGRPMASGANDIPLGIPRRISPVETPKESLNPSPPVPSTTAQSQNEKTETEKAKKNKKRKRDDAAVTEPVVAEPTEASPAEVNNQTDGRKKKKKKTAENPEASQDIALDQPQESSLKKKEKRKEKKEKIIEEPESSSVQPSENQRENEGSELKKKKKKKQKSTDAADAPTAPSELENVSLKPKDPVTPNPDHDTVVTNDGLKEKKEKRQKKSKTKKDGVDVSAP